MYVCLYVQVCFIVKVMTKALKNDDGQKIEVESEWNLPR